MMHFCEVLKQANKISLPSNGALVFSTRYHGYWLYGVVYFLHMESCELSCLLRGACWLFFLGERERKKIKEKSWRYNCSFSSLFFALPPCLFEILFTSLWQNSHIKNDEERRWWRKDKSKMNFNIFRSEEGIFVWKIEELEEKRTTERERENEW